MQSLSNTGFSQTARFFITVAAVGVTVLFLSTYRDIFNAVFLAQLVVLTASPIMYWLRQRNMPSWLSLLAGLVLTLSATLLIAFFIFLSALRLIEMLPLLADGFQTFLSSLSGFGARLGTGLETVLDAIDTDQIVALTASVLQGVLSSISVFGLMLLIVVFMVIEALVFPDKVNDQLASGNVQFNNLFGYTSNIRQYVGITSLLGVVGGVIAAILLTLIGVEFAVLWGVLYFVMNFVPMFGFWIAMLPPVLIALATLGPAETLLVFLSYSIMSFVINQVIKPAVMRGGLDLSPLWSILSMIVWSAILGIPGLIIGVPVTMAIKELLLDNDPDSRWISDMIGAGVRNQPTTNEKSAAVE